LAGSVLVSVHVPGVHSMIGGAPQAHAPVVQTLPPVHEIAQAPQLSLLVCVSTQLPTQLVSVASQVALHAPRLHTEPALHFVAHAPQWSGSLVISTQTPPQLVAVADVQTHIALEQVKPSPHTLPQAPQLFGSSMRRTH
jgi:hypothetical protein